MSENYTMKHSTTQNRRQRISEIAMVQNVTLVWLDAKIDDSQKDFQHSLTQLRRIVTNIDTFIDVEECLDHIQSIDDIHVFLIISGALGQSTMPHMHHLSNIDFIYVFCGDKAKQEQWASGWAKIAGVFTNIDQLCKQLKQDAELLDRTATSISITSCDLSRLEPSFMYTQLIKEILLKMNYERKRWMNSPPLVERYTKTVKKTYSPSTSFSVTMAVIHPYGGTRASVSPIGCSTRHFATKTWTS